MESFIESFMEISMEINPLWEELFKREGTSCLYPNHWRFLVEDKESVYYLEEGILDLFFTEVVDPPPSLLQLAENSEPFTADKLEGRQLFFKELQKGALFFSFPCRKNQLMHVVGRANGEVRVYKMKISLFINSLKDYPGGVQALTHAFSLWFSSFPPFFSAYRNDYPTSIIHRGQKIELQAPSTLVSGYKFNSDETVSVVWIRVIEGAFTLAGRDDLILSEEDSFIYPLVPEISLKSSSKDELEALSEEKIDYSEPFWKGLLRFHRDALVILADVEAEKIKKEGQKAQLFKAIDQKKVASSLTELERVLEKETFFKEPGDDLLYETAQLVGNQLHLTFLPPKELKEGLKPSDRLIKLCLDSQIHVRRTKRTEGWWRSDLGPFMSFFWPGIEAGRALPPARRWL